MRGLDTFVLPCNCQHDSPSLCIVSFGFNSLKRRGGEFTIVACSLIEYYFVECLTYSRRMGNCYNQ